MTLTMAWPHYGATQAGDRYAADVTLGPRTIAELKPEWTYRTGDSTDGGGYFGKPSNFQATPILVDDTLVFPTGFNRVIAVDAATGAPRWRFDPQVDFSRPYSEQFRARGVEYWIDSKPATECPARIFLGTLDARLFALDARTGRRCPSFGVGGAIDLSRGIARYRAGEYSVTSPPLAVGDVVVVGSSIGDNGAAELDSGIVRAFDARTGALRWTFDPAPTGAGGANVWSVMSADAERGLVFLPTTSPSPDFFGGRRPRDDGHANSLVALHAATGSVAWSYRIVRHDLWDYDLASQPLLIDWPVGAGLRPAVVVATKMGFVFVLDRETGTPLVDVEERTVPKSDVPGEVASRTQRFSSIRLHPIEPKLPPIFEFSPDHAKHCRRLLAGIRFEGIFTPPSLGGSLVYPGNPGGTNWGAIAVDAKRRRMLMVVNRLPTVVKLFSRDAFDAAARTRKLNGAEAEFTAMAGTPYGMGRYHLFNHHNKVPCLQGPWGQLVAVEVGTGRTLWRAPAGRAPGVPKSSPIASWGLFGFGGPLLTAGGLAFLGTPFDKMIRAYDAQTGALVWEQPLPAGAYATPMAYRINNREFIVIAAGGDRRAGEGRGDYLVAYSRPVAGAAAESTAR